ncbi:MAG: NAD(P)/FAD-dependent oxidoreductase [Candidatus Diapherotrites archaeon]|nr:NAD(P)/FAD-dependent oxidoreductase [Candidatus Diapherotrites archaeon]
MNPERKVVCGGLISAETLRRYPFLEEFAIHHINGAVVSAGGEEIVVKRKNVAVVLDRTVMFRGMLERAASAGAELHFRRWEGGDGYLVGADGATSSLRPLVTKQKVSYVLGVQAELPWEGEEDLVRVDFGPWSDVFFGWVIPLGNGRAHVGLGLSLERSSEAKTRLKLYGKYLGLPVERFEARLIPVSPPLRRVAKGKVFLVGDAAVHTKASTGGGIAYGFRGIDLLVEAVEKGDPSLYNRLHRVSIYPRLFLHWLVHRFYNSVDLPSLLRSVKELGLEKELSKRGSMDDPLFLLSPVFLKLIPRTFFPSGRTPPGRP